MTKAGARLAAAGQATAQSRKRPWAGIATATLLNLPLGSLYAFSVFLRPLEQELGASRSELATVFALATICYTVGMNLAPRLYRLLPAPALILLCVLGATTGIALSAAARHLPQLVLGYSILFGICGGCAYVLAQQGVNLMISSHHGLINGYIVSLYPLGAMIAAPSFGWAIDRWGMRAALAGLAGAIFILGTCACLLSVYAGMRLRPPTGSGPLPARSSVAAGGAIFWKLFTVFFLAAAAGLMVLSQAKGIVSAYGGSDGLALAATTIITGSIAGARIGGGWLVDRLSVPAVMASAQALALIGALCVTLWPTPLVSVPTLAMVGMGYGLISGATAGAIAFYWSNTDYGRIAGRLYIAWCIAAVSLPVLAGHLFDKTGGYGSAMIIAGCGNLFGIMVALTLPRQVATASVAGAASAPAAS
jgi:MFS transporter, OFA family, oxalate/formate antiporter